VGQLDQNGGSGKPVGDLGEHVDRSVDGVDRVFPRVDVAEVLSDMR